MKFFNKFFTKVEVYLISLFKLCTSSFITVHKRPFYEKDIKGIPDLRDNIQNIAIVIQGRMVAEYNFTTETIRLYRKFFPKIKIILSTWSDKALESVEKLEDENIFIIINSEIENPGVSNVNYQILSTTEGIKKARELGAKYVLKTRTDQRMYSSNIFKYFDSMLAAFPLKTTTLQKERLIGVSMNTFKYRPYSISDMNMYGTIDDMERYWCTTHSDRKNTLPPNHSILEWSKGRHAEMYFSCNFIESLGGIPVFTIEDSWRFYRDCFCIIDKEPLDLYWHKYESYKEYRRIKYDAVYNDQELGFNEWLSLYTNQNEIPRDEILNQQFGAKM